MAKLFAQNRNFRIFLLFFTFLGVGNGIFRIFMMWVVHTLFQNPIYTGIAGFMFGAPMVISFIAGPFVDRWNKITVLRVVSFADFCVVALVLLVTVFLHPGVWFFHLAILICSLTGVFGRPAYTALGPRIVKGEDLVKANSLLNISAIIAGIGVGAGLYSLMVRGADFTVVFGVNAAVLLAAVPFALLLRSNEAEEAGADKIALGVYFNELKEGMSFIKKGVMLPLVLAVLGMGFFADVAYVNLPMFAEVHLGTASGYIILSALALLGGLIGSILSRAVETKLELWKILAGGFVLAGVTRILFVHVIADNTTRAILIYILYVGLGSAVGIFYSTIQQKFPPKNLISRVSATITSLGAIAAATGALAGGVAGTLLPTVDMVFILQGSSYIAIGVLLCLPRHVRSLPKISEIGGIPENEDTK